MARIPEGYQTVTQRVAKFRADHPEGAITTRKREVADNPEIVEVVAYVFRNHAEIKLFAESGIATATGTAQTFGIHEIQKGVEKLESVAIGRALANLGYEAVEVEAPEAEEPKQASSEPRKEEKAEKPKFGSSRFQKRAEASVTEETDESEEDEKNSDDDDQDEESETTKPSFTRGSRFQRKG